VVNDAPCLAGLHALIGALESLTKESDIEKVDRDLWKRLKDALPPMPTGTVDGKNVFLVAEKYKDETSNVENPELYTVFPFRLCNITTPDLHTGIESFNTRKFPGAIGWYQDGQQAALLGLTEYAAKAIVSKVANTHPAHRFQAMWGPNFDWLPDQDHGSNMVMTLQTMLMQSYGDSIYILPAFPSDWNVSFRLAAPGRTTVTCNYKDGELRVDSDNKRMKIVKTDNR